MKTVITGHEAEMAALAADKDSWDTDVAMHLTLMRDRVSKELEMFAPGALDIFGEPFGDDIIVSELVLQAIEQNIAQIRKIQSSK